MRDMDIDMQVVYMQCLNERYGHFRYAISVYEMSKSEIWT